MIENTTPLEKAIPALISWYHENRKPLPWRIDPSPYHVWISEIMLQQTRIEAVIPYYYRFLSALPDIRALASVDDDELMKLWQGLGYYSRARNLKKGAQLICDEYGGELPKEAKKLVKIPGIGAYTAGAISSIAYGQPEPAVDGNVLRVAMRLCACEDDIAQSKVREDLANFLRSLYPSGKKAGELTEGIMELGETICIPNGVPLCESCPVRSDCRAYLENRTGSLPVKSEKKARRIEEKTVLLLECGGKYALRKRPPEGLLAGLWEFPWIDGMFPENDIAARYPDAVDIRSIGQATHIFTHIEWRMTGYRLTLTESDNRFVWASPDEIHKKYAIPTAFRFFTKQIK